MKIIYLHQYFNNLEMSGGTRSFEIARRLVAQGHEVHLITSWREVNSNSGWFQTLEEGIHVHWLPIPYSNKMSYGERIRAFFKFAISSSFRASKLKGDVVIATSTPLTIFIPGIFASIKNKIPLVFEVRDLWPELPIAMGAINNKVLIVLARLLEYVAYSSAHKIVALSVGMKEGIERRNIDAKKIEVIPNGSDTQLFFPNPSAGAGFRKRVLGNKIGRLIVYAGTLGHINGVGYLVEMAGIAKSKGLNLFFLIVGDGAEKEKIFDRAVQLGVLGENLFMIPPVQKKDMPEVFSAADMIVSLFIDLESMWANSANKFFDGLASGTPIAINYQGWQASLLKKHGAGVVLPARDPEGAVSLLHSFFEDETQVLSTGKAARGLAVREFDRDGLAKQFENVLLDAVVKK